VAKEVETKYPEIPRSNGAGLKKSTAKWDRLMAKLRADQKIYDQYDAAAGEFGEALKNGNTAALPAILAKVESCQRALPNHALLVSAVGVVNDTMGRTAEAKRRFEQAAAMQSDLFEPRLYLGRIALDSGDPATAHRFASEAVALYPVHYGAQFIDGRALDSLGKTSEAMERYHAVVELAPKESKESQFCAARIAQLEGAGARP
jgi:tetratricopeptide (TPR) repeat protein